MTTAVSAKHLRFLVVEGQGDLRRTITTMLRSIGAASVQSCSDNEEATELLRNNPIDFVLCDWGTPDSPGIELLKQVRQNPMTAFMPFLLMSRSNQLGDEERAEANEYEVDGFIIKPLNQQELEEQVLQVLTGRAKSMDSEVSLARASAFTDIGAYDEAELELETAQQQGPDRPRVWVRSGELYEEMGRDEKAKFCYLEARKVNDECVKAYDGLAEILDREGKPEEAFKLLQRAVSISPRNQERQMRIARGLLERGKEEEARIALHRALSNQGSTASRNAAVAEFFLSVGRADLAETEYGFALEADPDNVHYYNRLGIAFRRQKKLKEAVDNYRKALAVAPNNAVIYYNMALAMAESKEYMPAIGALRRALVLQADFPEAERLLNKLQSI